LDSIQDGVLRLDETLTQQQRIERLESALAMALQRIDELELDTAIPDVVDRRDRRVAITKLRAQGMSGRQARKAVWSGRY
jgi:hypothetical protein